MKLVSPNEYYNAIAEIYDEQLSAERDLLVRKEIISYFITQTPKGTVLDFGGGTGLDLQTLQQQGYRIYFCEPAEQMRAKALALNLEKVRYLHSKECNYKIWTAQQSPFDTPLQAILLNFGVINYIHHLPELFERFAEVTDKQANLVISLLRPQQHSKLGKVKHAIKSLLQTVKTSSSFNGLKHETMLYSIQDLTKAASPHFELHNHKVLGNQSDFTLLHFQKA